METCAKLVVLLILAVTITLTIAAGGLYQSGSGLAWDLLLVGSLFAFFFFWMKLTTRYGAAHLVDGLRSDRKSKR